MRDFSYTVRLPDETTRVLVGPLAELPLSHVADTGCLLVDEQVQERFGAAIAAFVARLVRRPATPIVLGGGEGLKDLGAASSIWSALSTRGLDRGSLLIAAGGGSVLDTCGFVAATFLRGVLFAAVPTTLLAQVDASIGGKCGLNLDRVKNQIGVIRQPRLVAVDPAFVESLPERSFRSGLGELAKCALLSGGELHALLCEGFPAILRRERAPLEQAILLALRYKAEVVGSDPFDRGRRALLNAGHTVGHVLETEALRRGIDLPHGEAVAIGLAVEAQAEEAAGRECIRTLLDALSLPSTPPFRIGAETAHALLQRDKKHRGGFLTLPVIERPGAVVLREVPIRRLVSAMTA